MEPGTPYCGHCGYQLTGAVESSRCPECGKPIVEVLRRVGAAPLLGRRYESPTRIFGLPLLSIAFGPHRDERLGRARGIIAIGEVAHGWLAIGGRAFGIFAFGGLACGVFALGGLAIGVFSFAGLAIGLLVAMGGGAIGGAASGGVGIGFIGQGGMAIGQYARGGTTIGRYVLSPTVRDPEALRFFGQWSDLLGPNPVGATLPLAVAALAVCVAIALAGIAAIAIRMRDDRAL